MEASIWTGPMVSALGNGVKGGKWYSLIDKAIRPATLECAWRRVARNKGAAGVDGQSIARFTLQADRYLRELHEDLNSGSYRPSPVRRVEIPKGDGKTRPLGIPTVKDRIVQTALKLTIEPILEARFRDGSYGFRPGRGCKDALRAVDRALKDGYAWVVDADLERYFDTIPRRDLMARLGDLISDGRVLELIDSFPQQDIMTETARWTPVAGAPQGAVISPILSNLYLHPLDELMEAEGYRMIRYADDFVVLCRDEAQARAALARVQAWVADNGLTLHPDKTHVGDCRQPGQGFDFLGYRFEARRRYVRDKSLKAFKDKIRARTGRSRGVSLDHVIADLNPVLRGWFGYFQHARARLFTQLDKFIRRRLRAMLRKQSRRPGFGKSYADHRQWTNAYFATRGLFTLSTALRQARHSR
ncbi:group II intron reverse transcriptase/maturase [Skermanella rosea]|uniref:group II intron reverse transcriptase/maturase n=1 Tax=Skermanella rosea TaxID=1817965 RepID=UPI0019345BBD|nr:group II intron reverse transcriptase/maturase [Skermanella rosea]UEM01819.1 group II intron reverse transcriptase/maturase [Skermanella rosea]